MRCKSMMKELERRISTCNLRLHDIIVQFLQSSTFILEIFLIVLHSVCLKIVASRLGDSILHEETDHVAKNIPSITSEKIDSMINYVSSIGFKVVPILGVQARIIHGEVCKLFHDFQNILSSNKSF